MAKQKIVALDIGTTKISCAVGIPKDGGGFELLGTSLLSPSPSVSSMWDPVVMGQTIEQALEATGITGNFSRAFVAVSHAQIRSHQVRTSIDLADEPVPVRSRDLERLTHRAIQQALSVDHDPILVEKLGFSGGGFDSVQDPLGLVTMRLQGHFHVVTLPVAVRRMILQAVEACGLEVEYLGYALKATFSAIENVNPQQATLLLDIGGLSTDIGIFQSGVLKYATIVPWGGSNIAQLISEKCHVGLDQAQRWVAEGVGCNSEQARGIIEAQLDQIDESLQKFLDESPPVDAVLLSGRACLMDGLAERIERRLGLEIDLCRSNRTQRFGDLSRQVALTTALGLLDKASPYKAAAGQPHGNLLARAFERTKAVLTEYF